MALLTLNLFGPLQVLRDDAPVAFRSDKERALLVFLAVEADRPHRREALTGLFYPEQEQTQAQSNLRKTLFRLRSALGETDATPGLLLITPKTVQFNPAAPHALDIERFRACLAPARRHTHRRAETCAVCAENLLAASELYRGEFLAGFNRSGSDAFEEWAVITRERLHQDALAALEQLVAFYLARYDWERTRTTARRLLELEAWHEPAHRALMTAYAAQGQRAAAFAQYNACKNILAAQFGAEPERSTRELDETIRAGSLSLPSAPGSNLPPPLTPLIGRARELETLDARLLDPALRLHTLVGPGGIGKTRLALATAERVRHDFRDGAFFVALASIPSDTPNVNDAIATAAADALGVTFTGSVAPAQQLQNYLRDKEMLLVLDNLEQLMSAAPWIVELLSTAPLVTLLITSREPLNVRAESVLRLDGLSVPAPDDEIRLGASDGVQLFVERAARAAGQFTVTPDNLRLASEICRRVQGMPLALELAAAWMRTRTLQEIATALDENMDLLTSTARDIPARHASLRAVWQGSWDLLTPQEQVALSKTVVFSDGFDQKAAKEIIKTQQIYLDALVDKSLLKRSDSGRYKIHELLYQFMLEYRVNNNIDLIYGYCAYYLEFIAQNGILLENYDPILLLAQIRAEFGNLRAAWHNTVQNGWLALLTLPVVHGIVSFYYLTGLYREGLGLVEQALTRATRTPDVAPHLVPLLQLERANFLERLARYDEAMQLLDALFDHPDITPPLRARAQLRAGWVCYWTGKLEQGRAVLQETFAWADANKEPALAADTLYVAGLIEQSASDSPRAREFYERALELYRANHNRYGESSALVNLADIGIDNTRLNDALRYGQAALALSTEIGKRFDQAAANVIVGSFYAEIGNGTRALPYYHDALRLFREMGNASGESIALRDLAMLALVRGDITDAFAYADQALVLSHQVGSPYRQGMTHCVLGEIHLATGAHDRAEQAFVRAIELLHRAERGHRALDAEAGLVRVALARGPADVAYERATALLDQFDPVTFADSQDPALVYLACYQALIPFDAERARAVLQQGLDDLNARAARIEDETLRETYLQGNPSARALLLEARI